MSILSHALGQDALLVSATVDKYGDQVPTEQTSVKCRFRYITQLDRTDHAEALTVGSDAIIWFEPNAPVVEGMIVKVDDMCWRVDKLVKARRLSGSTVYFLKAFVVKHDMGDFS